jgi:hypothetical protein
MKKYLAILTLATTAFAGDPATIDFSSANFQAAVQRAAQQALLLETDQRCQQQQLDELQQQLDELRCRTQKPQGYAPQWNPPYAR